MMYFICIVFFLLAYRRTRFYIFSFFHNWFYEHFYIASMLGIQFKDDVEWKTNRKESMIYMPGLFVKLFTTFTGMPLIMSDNTRHKFIRLQGLYAKNINIAPYFKQIENTKMSVYQYEQFLSRSILIETNRVFNILDAKTESKLLDHIDVLRDLINALTGDRNKGFKLIFKEFRTIMEISKILKSVPEELRLFLFVPQLTLVSSFSKMIIDENGNLSDIEVRHFLKPVSKFFVFLHNGNLTYVHRQTDYTNTPNNRAFGPLGFQCPGSNYTFKFLASILEFMKTFNVTIYGPLEYKGDVFKHLVNKNDVYFKFNKKF